MNCAAATRPLSGAEEKRGAAAAPRRQALRARAHRAAARRELLRRDRQAGHAPLPRFRDGRADRPGRRLRHRLGPHRRPPGVRLRAGLHGLRRVALRGQRAENLQDHGPRAEERRAHHRSQRFGRRAHSGGRAVARRLRRYFPAQHAGERRGAADFRHHGAVRGRRGLFARHHRFRLHGGRAPATCSSPART